MFFSPNGMDEPRGAPLSTPIRLRRRLLFVPRVASERTEKIRVLCDGVAPASLRKTKLMPWHAVLDDSADPCMSRCRYLCMSA